MSTVVLDIRGLPGVLEMIADFDGQALQNKLRQAVYAGDQVFQAELSLEATMHHGLGEQNVPLSFAVVRSPKVSTRGGASGREIQAYVRPKSPLFNIFEPGAKPHTIQPGHVYRQRGARSRATGRFISGQVTRIGPSFLAGPAGSGQWSNEGRKRGAAFFSTHAVRHPGISRRPLLEEAFSAKLSAAEQVIAEKVFTFTRHR